MDKSYIKMRKNEIIYTVSTGNIFLKPGTQCIAKTDHGLDIGYTLKPCVKHLTESDELKGEIIRKATEEDLNQLPELEEIETKAFNLCKTKTKEKNLDMKLVNVKCIFDKTKIIFYFVAENRIDFRELVRDLASVFRTRIEMRQIGVRDESRMIGGYGPCGKILCCTIFRGQFAPVSIKMAKEQNLNLNSQKISGICGRLLCCLDYEHKVYSELNKNLPELGEQILVGEELYHVVSIDTLKQTIDINFMSHRLTIHREDIQYDGKKYKISQEMVEKIDHGDHEHETFDFNFKY
jgi:cell fate regulator YaaT (PSP1 superfamily)